MRSLKTKLAAKLFVIGALVFGASVTSLGAVATAQLVPGITERNNVTQFKTGDPEVDAAMAKARTNLPAFWAAFDTQKAGERLFALKVALPTKSGSLEHIWVNSLARKGDEITGEINNNPVDIADLKIGSKITFKTTQISDWIFFRNNKMVGNETMRPALAKMPPDEAAKIRAIMETP
jgi:uncharacterized protein YegJ (DUF2314 family)